LLKVIGVVRLRKMRWVGHVACVGENKNGMNTILVARPDGKGPLGRYRHGWKGNNNNNNNNNAVYLNTF
jgi:hypothetical protein